MTYLRRCILLLAIAALARADPWWSGALAPGGNYTALVPADHFCFISGHAAAAIDARLSLAAGAGAAPLPEYPHGLLDSWNFRVDAPGAPCYWTIRNNGTTGTDAECSASCFELPPTEHAPAGALPASAARAAAQPLSGLITLIMVAAAFYI